MGGGPSGPGPQSHPQMNGTTASAIHALPASLPGQSSSSALTQKLAGTQDSDSRRTMLGEHVILCHQEVQLSIHSKGVQLAACHSVSVGTAVKPI